MHKGEVIASVVVKVRALAAENRRLRAEGVGLGEELRRAKEENREMKGVVAGLEKRVKKLELREGFEGNNEGRARVNALIREVDKCIALLNR